MKPKKPIWFIAIFVVVMIVLLVLLTWNPTFMETISPDEVYKTTIQARHGSGLLNVPDYLTITVKNLRSLKKTTIYAKIDNDDVSLEPDYNVHTFWDDNQLVIILLGYDQPPEFIIISLTDGFPCERHQFDISKSDSDIILRRYGINTEDRGTVSVNPE